MVLERQFVAVAAVLCTFLLSKSQVEVSVSAANDTNSTITCRSEEEIYLYVNHEMTPCFFTTAEFCEPTERATTLQRRFPVEITHYKRNKNLSGIRRTVDVTWTQELPENSGVEGYVLRLTNDQPRRNKCYFVHFTEKLTLFGNTTFRLHCISWVTVESRTCSSIFPVFNNSTKQFTKRSEKPLQIDVAYNRDYSIMRVASNYSLYSESPYILRLVNGSTETECLRGERYPNFEHNITKHRDFMYINQSFIGGNFCVELVPLKTLLDSTLSQPFNFNRTDDFDIDGKCITTKTIDRWNATVYFLPDSQTLSWNLNFSPDGICSLKEYQIRLFNVNNITCGDVSKLAQERCTHVYDGSLSTKFSNLRPGSYCVRIMPISDFCGENKRCPFLYSEVKELKQKELAPSPVLSKLEQATHPSILKVLIPVVSVTVIALIVASVLSWRKRKRQQPTRTPQRPSLSDVIATVNRRKPVTVFLAHSVRNPLIRDAIDDLVNVLQFCLHCEVILNNYLTACKESDKSGINHLEWISRKLREVDFVLVTIPDYDTEDPNTSFSGENHSMYMHSIEIIKLNATAKWSQQNVCTFRFDNSPSYKILSDVDHTAWSLPKQLGNFYAHLHKESVLETEFQKYWKNNVWLNKLNHSLTSTPGQGCSEFQLTTENIDEVLTSV